MSYDLERYGYDGPPIDPGTEERRCRVCGCTDRDCTGCVVRTGEPCHWVEDDLCSACVPGSGGLASTFDDDPVLPALPPAFSVAPWRAHGDFMFDDELADLMCAIVDADGFEIAGVYDRTDARSVVAAICALPELLAAGDVALAAIDGWIKACSADEEPDVDRWASRLPQYVALKEAREQLERALARARNTAPGRSEG